MVRAASEDAFGEGLGKVLRRIWRTPDAAELKPLSPVGRTEGIQSTREMLWITAVARRVGSRPGLDCGRTGEENAVHVEPD